MCFQRIVISTFILFLLSVLGAAHPLGNFSVNQFARIEIESTQVKIRQVLDMAEIPTITELRRIDTNSDGVYSEAELNEYAAIISPGYLANIDANVGDRRLDFVVAKLTAEMRTGSGDLKILRIVWDLTSPIEPAAEGTRFTYHNRNYTERIGWNELVVKPVGTTKVYDSSAFGGAVTDELQTYPEDSLASPLAERTAAFTFTSGKLPENAIELKDRNGKTSKAVATDSFAALISVPEITPWIALLGVLAAFGLGALHAMSPGHGKTVVGAYLVGSNGTAKHAAFLGLTVTITHTLGVFALGFITLFASNYILPEKLIPMLSFISGVLVLYIGLIMLKTRVFAYFGWEKAGHQHDHGHSHDDHSDGHTHSHGAHTHSHGGAEHTHVPPSEISWRSLAALGISGGLLPCPSALVLMLSAITMNRVGYGLILTLVFSLGLAATLTAVGFAFLYLGKIFDSPSIAGNRVVKLLPVFSALVITCLGAALCYGSFSL